MNLALDQHPYEINNWDGKENDTPLGLTPSESRSYRKRTRDSSAQATKSGGFGGNLLGLTKAGKL